MDIYESIKKSFTFLFAVIGLLTFYMIFMAKVDALARQTEEQFSIVSDQIKAQGYLSQQAIASGVKTLQTMAVNGEEEDINYAD